MDFECTLIAAAHQVPSTLLPRVLELGKHVVEQYEAIIHDQIGGLDAVRALPMTRGINLEEQAA